MALTKPGWSDEQVERAMGNLLRVGVLAAAAVTALGGLLYLIQYGNTISDHGHFHGQPPELTSPQGVITDALALHSPGLIQLGLLVLIATPVARVVFSVIAFIRQRDRFYVGVTLFVLAVLLYSLFSRDVG